MLLIFAYFTRVRGYRYLLVWKPKIPIIYSITACQREFQGLWGHAVTLFFTGCFQVELEHNSIMFSSDEVVECVVDITVSLAALHLI